MNASPLLILIVLTFALLATAVFFLSIAQTCADRADGTLRSDRPVRSLLRQQARAERSAAWAFGLGFVLAMASVATGDLSMLV